MKKILSMVFAAFFSAAVAGTPVLEASVPKLLTYQGVLKDANGSYLTGSYDMTFRVYGASSGGSALWSESQTGVSVNSGRFSAELGSVSALNLDFSQDYWLSVQVGTDTEMTPRQRLTSAGYALMAESVVNGFSQAQHDALSHRDIEGVKANTANIAKTNFKLDAYTLTSANSMGDMIIDTFTDASGIDGSASAGYSWRGSPNYDVLLLSQNSVEYEHSNNNWSQLWLNCYEASYGSGYGNAMNTKLGQQFQVAGSGEVTQASLGFYDSSSEYGASWDAPYKLWVEIWTQDANGMPAARLGGPSDQIGAEQVNAQWWDGSPSILNFVWSADKPAVSGGQNYVLVVLTDYPYGNNHKSMRVATDSTGNYASGKALFFHATQNTWQVVDNNYDLTFKISITSSAGSATVCSIPFAEPVVPKEAMVIADEVLNTGTLTYYVSRNNGVTWTACPNESVVSLNSQPQGTQLRWKAVITGNAQLKAIALSV